LAFCVPTDRFHQILVTSLKTGGSADRLLQRLKLGYDSSFWDSTELVPKIPNPFVASETGNDRDIETPYLTINLESSWLLTIQKLYKAYNPDPVESKLTTVGLILPLRLLGGSANSYQYNSQTQKLEITLAVPSPGSLTINAFSFSFLSGSYYRTLFLISTPLINLETDTDAYLDLNLEFGFSGGEEQ